MKKLTAGIFTVLMGLVTADAAFAAVASKGYVDEVAGANTTLIENLSQTVTSNKEAADATATGFAAYKTANDTAVAGKADKATTLAGYGIGDAYTKSEMDGLLGAKQNSITLGANLKWEDGKLTTDGIATTAGLSELQSTVSGHTTTISGIQDSLSDTGTIGSAVKTNTENIGSLQSGKADKATTLGGYGITDAYTKSETDGLIGGVNSTIGTVADGKTVVEMISDAQTAATYDDDEVRGLIGDNADAIATNTENIGKNAAAITTIQTSEYATSGATKAKIDAIETNTTNIATNTTNIATNAENIGKNADAIESMDTAYKAADTALDGRVTTAEGEIDALQGLVGNTAVATQISNAISEANLSQYVTSSGLSGALADYAKTSSLGKLAAKDTVGTNDIDDNAVTSAKIAPNAVTNDKIESVASAKVTGLQDALDGKISVTGDKTVAGQYVLTAKVADDGTVSDYAWELVERDDEGK